MKRILLSGYYGFDNAGDEAVLAGLIAGFRNISSNVETEVTALSIAPGRTTSLHCIPAKDRYKQVLGALLQTDLLLSGGGSLLQDVTSAHGIFYYLATVRIAQILGKKTMFVAQGIGPLTLPRSRKLTASVANRLDAITVRDPDSKALLQSIGVTKSIAVTADPALLLAASICPSPSGLLLSMRPWRSGDSISTAVADALAAASLPLRQDTLNMHGKADRDAASAVLGALGMSPQPASDEDSQSNNFQMQLSQVASSQMVVAMRLHALIFAAAAGIPMAALSYDPKINAFMQQIGQADACVDVNSINTSEFADLLRSIWATRSTRSELLRAALPGLRHLAQENTNIALNLISKD